MMKQRIAARNNSVNGVLLVRTKFYLRVHFGKPQITSVVFRQSDLIEQPIVYAFEFFSPFGIAEYPVLERFHDFVLLLSRRDRFGVVKHSFFSAVRIQNRIVNLRGTLIQTIFKQPVCVRPFCAVYARYVHRAEVSHIPRRAVYAPTAVVFVVIQFDAVAHIIRKRN